ncbi:hypothetical protein D3C87_1396050 [compost metagenome]
MALSVTQLADELIGLGAGRGTADLCVARIGAAVGDVVANGTVQQGSILGDHADGAAQAVLRDVRDVLPVNANLPAVDVVEAQQQVDQRGFARARAANQADFFARANVQAQAIEHLAFAAVVEADIVEGDRPAGGHQHTRVRRILHLGAAGQCCHAILHGADALEQRGHLPHDPVRHAIDTQRHGGDCRHGTSADLALMP